MSVAYYIVFFITGIYSVVILLLAIGWCRLKSSNKINPFKNIPISIIIACRNEEKNIKKLLDALISQNYPKEYTNIIIINDHSEDKTEEIITEFIQNYDYIQLLNLPENKQGKKSAIAMGVENATSDIIITTDADCIVSKEWLNSMVSYYQKEKPQIVSGPVVFSKPQDMFQKFQTLEFISLVGSGAGAIGMQRPIMCNGANLLFKKELYIQSNLNTKYESGDDIFLMLHAKKKSRKAIGFNKSKDAIVYTKPSLSITDFFNQRIRWTSKSKAYRDFDINFVAITTTLLNLICIVTLISGLFNLKYLLLAVLMFVIKSLFDLLILIPVTLFFNQQKLLWIFIPLQIVYPFYIVWTVIKGLIGKFEWKSRKSG